MYIKIGREQALNAGTKLAPIIGNRPLYVFISPYQRTRQTAQLVKSELLKVTFNISSFGYSYSPYKYTFTHTNIYIYIFVNRLEYKYDNGEKILEYVS